MDDGIYDDAFYDILAKMMAVEIIGGAIEAYALARKHDDREGSRESVVAALRKIANAIEADGLPLDREDIASALTSARDA
jgi:hypothetical protein